MDFKGWNHKSFGIISAERPEVDQTYELLNILNKRFKYEPIDGHWKGQPEKSFVVFDINLESLLDLAKRFGQEAVVYKPENGVAQVVHLNEL